MNTLIRIFPGFGICLLLLSQQSLAQSSPTMLESDHITQTTEINGYTFPYFDMGEGPVVLLLHGFPDSRYVWRHQLQPLAEAGYRVIAPDLRGFGDAPKPTNVSDYAFPLILSDIMGLLHNLSIEKVHIVGHDWGGTLAWAFAAQYPEKTHSVSGVTVGAIGAPGRRSIPQMEKLWYIFLFLYEEVAEQWLMQDDWKGLKIWTRGKGDLDRYIQQLSQPYALTAGLNWYRANFNPASINNSQQHATRIKVPALGIAAEYDEYLLAAHVETSAAMIDAEWTYHLVKEASHWVMLDKPQEFNDVLIDFLNEIEGK